MRPSTGYIACLAACALAVVLQPSVGDPADHVATAQTTATAASNHNEEADVVYPVAVLEDAGWERVQLNKANEQVERIFSQCGVTVIAGETYLLEAPGEFRVLAETMEPQLLAQLPARRPMVLLVDRTAKRDIAYAYLRAAPGKRRGTAWITRDSHPACLGRLIAHELGHILLDRAGHSHDRNNLMHHACAVSNISGASAGTKLTQSQCDAIRTWE